MREREHDPEEPSQPRRRLRKKEGHVDQQLPREDKRSKRVELVTQQLAEEVLNDPTSSSVKAPQVPPEKRRRRILH